MTQRRHDVMTQRRNDSTTPRRVFVTGGACRLGRALAEHLAKSGQHVFVHYHASRKEAESLQTQIGCELFQADFSRISIDELRRRLADEVGFVDALVNNASSFQRMDWTEIQEDFWDRELSVNLKIPFFLSQHFGRQMKTKGSGKILNIADIAAERPYVPYLPYSISKAGIVAFTRAFARALAPEVQVNAIAPGVIEFPESFSEQERQRIIDRIPAGRTGTIAEFLGTVDFLLSDVDYITGQTIVMDGGRSLMW